MSSKCNYRYFHYVQYNEKINLFTLRIKYHSFKKFFVLYACCKSTRLWLSEIVVQQKQNRIVQIESDFKLLFIDRPNIFQTLSQQINKIAEAIIFVANLPIHFNINWFCICLHIKLVLLMWKHVHQKLTN